MTAGVYMITNVKDGRVYIGESANIERRWQKHLRALAEGRHHNRHLQAAFEKGSVEDFHFSVLVDSVLDHAERLAMECQWADKKHAWIGERGYNIDIRTPEMRDWMAARECAKRRAASAERRRLIEEKNRRVEAQLIDEVKAHLSSSDPNYADRECLLQMFEFLQDQLRITLSPAGIAASDSLRAAKRSDPDSVRAG